jgi:hypothetical protein
MARVVAANPGDQHYLDLLEQVRADRETQRQHLADHEAECTFVAEAPKPIRGVRQRPAPKPKRGAKVAANRAARVPDRAELEAAIAATTPAPKPAVTVSRTDTRHLPVTGYCHDCDKPIPPGRRLCGRCLARRHL